MQINIQVSEPIEVTYGEKKFSVCRPKVGVVRDFQKQIKACEQSKDGAEIEVMMSFCLKCGVPQDVFEDWNQVQIQSFFMQMSGSEKKT